MGSAGADARHKSLRLYDTPENTFPTYNGDYSGRRYAIRPDQRNQYRPLKIDWMYRIRRRPAAQRGRSVIKSTPLLVDGVLYFTIPDHVFAINARTGERSGSTTSRIHGGHLVGQRGVGMYGSWLYFLTPDGWFISLTPKMGRSAGGKR